MIFRNPHLNAAIIVGICLLTPYSVYAGKTCTGGISANCGPVPQITCNIPIVPVAVTVVCRPSCAANGVTPNPNTQLNLSGNMYCGTGQGGVIYVPTCPPTPTYDLKVDGATSNATMTITLQSYFPLEICIPSSATSQVVSCSGVCICSR